MSNDLELQNSDKSISAVQIFNDGDLFNRAMKMAEVMATSKNMVPAHLRTSGDCLGVILDSWAWKLNPFAVARKTHIINGIIGYEAQVISAAVNNSPEVIGGFKFEWFGEWEKVIGKFEIKKNTEHKEYRVPGWKLADEEGLGIRVSATRRGDDIPMVLELLLAQARTRNSTLWADDPKQQLAYLAQKKWARLYTPGIIMGAYSIDEIQDQDVEPKDITPNKAKGVYATPSNIPEEKTVEEEIIRLEGIAKKLGLDAYKKAWADLGVPMRKSIGAKKHEEMKSLAEGKTVLDGSYTQVDTKTGEINEPNYVKEITDAIHAATTPAELSNATLNIDKISDQYDKNTLLNLADKVLKSMLA